MWNYVKTACAAVLTATVLATGVFASDDVDDGFYNLKLYAKSGHFLVLADTRGSICQIRVKPDTSLGFLELAWQRGMSDEAGPIYVMMKSAKGRFVDQDIPQHAIRVDSGPVTNLQMGVVVEPYTNLWMAAVSITDAADVTKALKSGNALHVSVPGIWTGSVPLLGSSKAIQYMDECTQELRDLNTMTKGRIR